MSNVIVLSSSETLNSISPHVENAKQLRDNLGYDLCLQNEEMIREMFRQGSYDAIIFTYGTGREFTSATIPAINGMVQRTGKRPKLFYMKNEYNLGENHTLWALCRDEGYTYEMITNNTIESESRCKKYWTNWHIINIQNLVWNNKNIDWFGQQPPPSLFPISNNYGLKEHGLFYYGSYRKEREKYFKYWLDNTFRVSTSIKNYPKFRNIVPDIWLFPPLTKREDLVKFKYTLYMEDMVSTKYFTHLSNRFYECLEFDVLMFFDSICKKSIDRDIYPIDEWFLVKDKKELSEKIAFCELSIDNFLEKLRLQRVNREKIESRKQETLFQINKIILL